MFSVIIAAKNSEKWISKTINSLIKQTFENWECIISINGSTDLTKNISEEYCRKDKRFKIIEHEFPNKSSAINRSLFNAKNEWICILDADDLWKESKLELQKNFIISNKIDIIGTQINYIDENDNYLNNSPFLPINNFEIYQWLDNKNNPIANSSVCYKKEIHNKVGFYNTELFGVEDYDFWKRCKRFNLKFSNLEESLLLHRIHDKSNFNSTKKQESSKKIVDFMDDLLYK